MNDEAEDDDYYALKLKLQIENAKKKGLIQLPGAVPAVELPPTTREGLPRLAMPQQAQIAAELLDMKTLWVDVTPELATQWLQNNVCNRPLRKAVVANYARQMKRGEWLPIAQGIAFDTRHRLLNGQHRLSAVVQSGCTIRLLVTHGVPARIKGTEVKPMDLMDTGLPRSISDQLKIQHGISGGTLLTAMVRSILSWVLPQRTWKLSVGEVMMLYRLFQQPIDFVREHRSKEHGLKQAGVLTAFALAIAADPAVLEGGQATRYRILVGDGISQPIGPLALLADFLRAPDAILLTRTNDRALVPMVLGVLEAEMTGQAVTNLHELPSPTSIRAGLSAQIDQIETYFTHPSRTC